METQNTITTSLKPQRQTGNQFTLLSPFDVSVNYILKFLHVCE